LFRVGQGALLEVPLVHPGGPFWANKDDGAWSTPKGEFDGDEDRLTAARREFAEETGFSPQGQFLDLGAIRQRTGKTIQVWAVAGDWAADQLKSNTFEMEWPRNSGQVKSFPEVDRAAWFDTATARKKISKGQAGFIDRLMTVLDRTGQLPQRSNRLNAPSHPADEIASQGW
jgi:predicted NUDIX family NTP pyrophosphohydrolase